MLLFILPIKSIKTLQKKIMITNNTLFTKHLNILIFPKKTHNFSTVPQKSPSTPTKLTASEIVPGTEIVPGNSPQSQELLGRSIETTETDVTVLLTDIKERLDALYANSQTSEGITPLNYPQEMQKLQKMISTFSIDNTSFKETPFGLIIEKNIENVTKVMEDTDIIESLPYSRDSAFLDVDDFRALNSSPENTTVIMEYIKNIKALTAESAKNLTEISEPISSLIIKHMYSCNEFFKRFADNNFESFSIEINGTLVIVDLNSFQNFFTYVSQTYGHLNSNVFYNCILCSFGINAPTDFITFSIDDIEAIKTTYIEKALDIGDKHQKNILDISNDMDKNVSSISKAIVMVNKHPYFTVLSLATTGLISLKYFQPILFQQIFSTFAEYSYLNDIYNALGLDTISTATDSTSTVDTTANRELTTPKKGTLSALGISVIASCDKYYAIFRSILVNFFGEDS